MQHQAIILGLSIHTQTKTNNKLQMFALFDSVIKKGTNYTYSYMHIQNYLH